MKKTSNTSKMIQGIDADEYFGTTIGPLAAAIMEMLLTKYLTQQGEGMSGGELKMVQFAVEKSYGKAVNHTETVTRTETDIAADSLQGLDMDTLRKIAKLNAPRTLN